jgi:cephalosporin-C deacetylase-like acetyl esterase
LEGNDYTGSHCRIFIENEADADEKEITTTPIITTDSQALSWLEKTKLEGRITDEKGGIKIDIMVKEYNFTRTEHIIKKNGNTIFGEICKPVSDNDKLPMIIACHGYNSCSADMRYETELLAKRGIASYCFDFCGGGTRSKSSGTTTEMTLPSEQKNLSDVIKEISVLPFVDENNLYLFGMSQGGLISALTAPDFKNIIKALFLVFPAFCIPDHWAEIKRTNKKEYIEFSGMTLGKCFVDELPDYDVFERAAEFDKKVFIFHGECDPVVDVSYSEKLVKTYKDASLTVYPEQEHWFKGEYTIQMMKTIHNYIKEK